jgi:GTP-binding protein
MKTPLVVIVGRPNVGKSTLFNRLVGKREAIVDNISGVTRDRNYGEVEWNGKEFRLIDTGGFVPNSPDLFETAIREQIKIAIEESDKILFVVDAKDGINPVDKEIAAILRNSRKPFILIVNKIDSEKQDNLVAEFYSLGLGEPVPISALIGRRVGDFLDLLTEEFNYIEDDKEDSRLKIAIVGRPNVGKSSLTNALLGYDRSIVTNIPGTTRDSIDSILKYYGEEIILIDTAGLRKRTKIAESIEFFSTMRSLKAIADSDITIVLIDAVAGLEKQDQKILDEAIRRRKGIILAVNKWDLLNKETNTAHVYEKQLKSKFGNIDYIPVIFISALTKQRIYKLIDLAKKVEAERKKRIPTDELNEVLQAEMKSMPPPTTPTGKEVKIKYITQVGDHYPVFLFFTNNPKYVPDNYIRFLEKLIRKNWGYEGVPFTMSFKQK